MSLKSPVRKEVKHGSRFREQLDRLPGPGHYEIINEWSTNPRTLTFKKGKSCSLNVLHKRLSRSVYH
jgi:hypothetical protein